MSVSEVDSIRRSTCTLPVASTLPAASRLRSVPWTPQEPIAQLEQVTRRFGQVVALDGLTLRIHAGEVLALLGANGAGKTTAVRLLLGLLAPDAGQVRVMGADPRRSQTRTRVGAMLQVAQMPAMLRVRELIQMFSNYYPRPLASAEVVRLAQLEGIESRQFGGLSGGQKQRVLFGLALCGNPDLVFLDEPTVGMDIASRRSLWDSIRSLSAMGKAVLLTTHYLEEADLLASRIVVVAKGRQVAEGTPAQIKHRAGGRKVRCVTALSLEQVRALPGVLTVVQDREALVVETPAAEELVRALLAKDATLHSLEITSGGLEDAFLAITQNQAAGAITQNQAAGAAQEAQ